jgi:hypothetical protein
VINLSDGEFVTHQRGAKDQKKTATNESITGWLVRVKLVYRPSAAAKPAVIKSDNPIGVANTSNRIPT